MAAEKELLYVLLRFEGDWGRLVPEKWLRGEQRIGFGQNRSLKDLLESLGVPHGEIAAAQINGQLAQLTILVGNGERVVIFSHSMRDRFNRSELLVDNRLWDPRFVCDGHLGTLARRLRLLGCDVFYRNDCEDAELAARAQKEQLVLLTRDRGLLMRGQVTQGIFLQYDDPEKQTMAIIDRMDLRHKCQPFSRCLACNGLFRFLSPAELEHESTQKLIPAGVRSWCREFKICQQCQRIYWPGSHYQRLEKLVKKFLEDR